MVDKVGVRLVVGYAVEEGWKLEHMYIHSAFISKCCKFGKLVYIRKTRNAGGSYKHINTIGVLNFDLYASLSGTYYYLDCLIPYMMRQKCKFNEH